MAKIIETERLVLREFLTDDAEFIIELVNSPGWIAFIGDRNIKTVLQATAYLQHGPIKSYEENGYGLYLVELKKDNKPIGMCGIIKRDTLDNPDIGFAFLPEYTGQGYAFEIASATMVFANETLKLPVIMAITVPHNQSSIKLLEKLGMRFERMMDIKQEQLMLFSTQ